MNLTALSSSVVVVGDGRGFVMRAAGPFWYPDPVIVTAAHCLPTLPPRDPNSFSDERTYMRLLGRLGECPHIAAECLFVDPISDLALLGSPDGQEVPDEAGRFCDLVDDVQPFALGDNVPDVVFLLSLAGEWFESPAKTNDFGRGLFVRGPLAAGMSGSPIVDARGAAIGVASTASETDAPSLGPPYPHGPQPLLAEDLPVRWVRALAAASLGR